MIISLSGKIGSGKDTVTKIIQILSANPHFDNEAVIKFLKRDLYQGKWENKKWADKLKDIVCLLINCTREQLEDREFKEKELGKDWWYYQVYEKGKIYDYLSNKNLLNSNEYYLEKHTPRTLLQRLGTECGREIIHPNIWVNALMSEYKVKPLIAGKIRRKGFSSIPNPLPNWIISDTRFPNEANTVKEYRGILVNIVRPEEESNSTHESETALDNYKGFDWEIRNTGNLDYLVDEVRRFMEVFEID